MTTIVSEQSLITKDDCDKKHKEFTIKQEAFNINQIVMSEDIKHIKKGIERIESTMEELNGKFAGKWVEKVIVYIGTTIGGLSLLGIVYLIIDTFLHINK